MVNGEWWGVGITTESTEGTEGAWGDGDYLWDFYVFSGVLWVWWGQGLGRVGVTT